MTATEVFWLVLAGVGMGAINNLAGAAGVLGLFALDLASGLTTTVANGSLRLAAIAIGLFGWVGFRTRGIRIPARAWRLAACTGPGALLGVTMALRLPEAIYHAYLLTVMVAVLVQQLRHRTPTAVAAPTRTRAGAFLALSLVGLHMGFVQVGVGLVAILALSRFHSRNLIEINTTKMALVLVAATVSLLEFTRNSAIAWGPAAVLAIAAGGGSYWASRWSVSKGHAAVRTVVVVITVLVIAKTLWQVLRAGA
ncbi:MAG: sulfite exporter TauE/SafE family protein [Planctomycetota bacterium]